MGIKIGENIMCIKQLEESKFIVIVRGVAKDKLITLAQAMYDGGIRFMECTYDSQGLIPDEEIADNIKMLSQHFENKMFIGAGTVLTEKQVLLTKEAGGKFIISPDTNAEIIKITKENGLVSIPGALTPTEIATAKRAGADFIKVFPMDSMGSKYLKDILAPLSYCKLLAVGGITRDNIKEYLNAGASGFGIGSGIVHKPAIESGDFEEITRRAKLYTGELK